MNDLRIDLYNRLTNINGIENEENFLCSINFKPNNGNILLDALEKIKKDGYNFSIIKGFIGEKFEIDEDYNKFKKCIVQFNNEIPNDINIYLNGLKLKKMKDFIYEFAII